MRILHLNTFDALGGAARAAYRLHKQLRAMAIDSMMYVQKKSSDDITVHDSNRTSTRLLNKILPFIDPLPLRFYKKDEKSFWSLNWFPRNLIAKDIHKMDPDIINVHWIGNGFVPVKMLGKLGKPIVWTMHDSWAFTGGCHVPYDCRRYMEQCGYCPQLRSKRENDLSRMNFKRKSRHVNNAEVTVVAPSKWMANNTSQSQTLRGKNILTIKNGIDLGVFKPLDKTHCRKVLNLQPGINYVLFCSGSFTDENKGFRLFFDSVKILRQSRKNVVALMVGSDNPPIGKADGFGYENLGKMSDDYSLALAYSAADITCVPSLYDNLPQAATESMACGTPVAAFNSSGLPDVIDHRINGFLAKPRDPSELASGMSWMLDNLGTLSSNARKKAERDFDVRTQALEYLKLYENIMIMR